MSKICDSRYSILVVDDKELDRNGICYLIEQYHLPLNPITTGSGQEALEILKNQKVDILFTDIKMPEMTGHELIREAQAICPDLRVIIFSSYENFDYAHQAIDLGVTKYLLKPIKIDKFLNCMDSMIASLEEESTQKAGAIYYDIITGCANLSGEDLQSVAAKGFIFLLDFVDPFFNRRHVNDLTPLLQNKAVISIPLNEYQCAFILPDDNNARQCITALSEKLDELDSCRYILVYGGGFDSFSQLKTVFDSMESSCGGKFYLPCSTVLYPEDILSNKEPVDVKTFLKKSQEIRKLIERKELNHAEEEIIDVFSSFQRETSTPTSFAKFICTEIVKAGLNDSMEDYNELLLRYIGEIEDAGNIEELKNICISIVRHYSQQEEETLAIGQALDIISKQYMNNISLESVAASVYLSSCYFSYLFKKTTNVSFIKYLTSYRVDVAKNLLRTTKLKVGNICEMVGYSNVSYFCQIFKNYCGMTPAQFRGSKL